MLLWKLEHMLVESSIYGQKCWQRIKMANSSIRNFVIETNYERVILEAELANGDNEIDDGIRARLSSLLRD